MCRAAWRSSFVMDVLYHSFIRKKRWLSSNSSRRSQHEFFRHFEKINVKRAVAYRNSWKKENKEPDGYYLDTREFDSCFEGHELFSNLHNTEINSQSLDFICSLMWSEKYRPIGFQQVLMQRKKHPVWRAETRGIWYLFIQHHKKISASKMLSQKCTIFKVQCSCYYQRGQFILQSAVRDKQKIQQIAPQH